MVIFDELLPFFENAQEDAFAAGRGDLVRLLDELIVAMDQVQNHLTQPSEEKKVYILKRTKDFETALFASITQLTGLIHQWLDLDEITEDNLPPELLGQLKSKAGNYAALIYPSGSIWNIAVLDRFVTQLEKYTTNLTGFPVTHRFFVRQAASAVIHAVLYSLAMILIVLAFDLKQVKVVLFALVPLVVGMLWMQGVLYVLGISYNVANIAALPLLLGLSVVYGLHIVHRWQESPGTFCLCLHPYGWTGRGLCCFYHHLRIGQHHFRPPPGGLHLRHHVVRRHYAIHDCGLVCAPGPD